MEKLLIEVCDIQYGFPFDSSKFSETEGTPLIRVRDVTRGYSETFTTEDYSPEYMVYDGDLLVGMDGEFNIAKWGREPALLNQRVCRLIPHNSSIDKGYLYYYMPTVLKQIEAKTPFVTVKHLSAKELNKVKIPLPPLDKQRHIAAVLDKVSDLIAKRRQQLDKLDEMVKARFVEMFGNPITNEVGWDKVRLSTCIESIDNGKSLVCDASARQGNWPAVLKLSAATYGFYRPEENKAMLDENQFVEDVAVRAGDLLFTRKNTPELVGMCAYVYGTPSRLMMPDLIFRLNTTNRCNKVFLWKLINHDLFRDSIKAIATGSAKSMSNISKERLLNLEIILPPVELQEQFAAFVKQTDKSKLTLQRSLDKLEVLKKALMQRYFGQESRCKINE